MGNVWSGATGGNLGEIAAKATEHTGEGAARTLAPAITDAAEATEHVGEGAARNLAPAITNAATATEHIGEGAASNLAPAITGAATATEHTGEGAARTLAPAVTAAAGATQHTFRDAAEILEGIIGDLRRDVERLVQGMRVALTSFSLWIKVWMTLLVFSASAHLLSQSTVGSMAGDCITGALSMVWLARSVLQDVGQAVTLQVAKLALQVWGASAVGAAIGVAKGLIGTLMDWLVICFIGGVMIKMAADSMTFLTYCTSTEASSTSGSHSAGGLGGTEHQDHQAQVTVSEEHDRDIMAVRGYLTVLIIHATSKTWTDKMAWDDGFKEGSCRAEVWDCSGNQTVKVTSTVKSVEEGALTWNETLHLAVVEQSHELRISLLHPLTGGLFSRPLEALVVAASSVSIHKLSHGAPVNRGWLRLFKPAGDEEGGCIELQTTFRPSSIAPQWIKVSDPASGPVPPSSIVINGTECRNTDGSLFCLARGCATREEGMQIGFASMASPNMQYGFACIRREMSTYEILANPQDFDWIRLDESGVRSQAVIVGFDCGGEPLFPAIFGGSGEGGGLIMIPGKAGRHLPNHGLFVKPVVANSCEWTSKRSYVMCARPVRTCARRCPMPQWSKYQAGNCIDHHQGILIDGRVVRDASDAIVHIARGAIAGKGFQVGKAPADRDCLLYGYNGAEEMCSPYEVLLNPSDFVWTRVHDGILETAVPLGLDVDGSCLYSALCVGHQETSPHRLQIPGKAKQASDCLCGVYTSYTYGGIEYVCQASDTCILCFD